MISSENESAVTPEDLANLRDQALRKQTERSKSEGSWKSSYDRADYQSADESLQMSRFLAIAALLIIAAAVIWPASFSGLFAAWGILLLYCVHSIYQHGRRQYVLDKNAIVGFQLPLPKSSILWGITIPLSMTACLCVVMSRDIVFQFAIDEWLFSGAFTAFCCGYVATALSKPVCRPKLVGFLNGLTIGFASSVFALFAVELMLADKHFDPLIMLPTAGLLAAYSLGQTKQLLLKVERNVSLSVFCTACLGALTSFAVCMAPELRGLAIDLGEKLAISSDTKTVDLGYKILGALNAAPELAAFVQTESRQLPATFAAAFTPIDRGQAAKMLFFLSGKTRKQKETTISNFQNVRVADPNTKVAGLSLVESTITGHVDANSLTSVTYWTMVFGNNTPNLQEAQTKISLPPNSAVSRVTLWVNGKPQEAAFNSTERVTQAYQWITERHRDPLLITEPSPGVISLQAYPVPKYGEMKVRIGITSGLDAKSKRDFSFSAPHIISSNFGFSDAKTFIKLESNAPITSNASQSKGRIVDGKQIYTGQIEPGGAHNYQFVAHRSSDFARFSARATHSKEDMIIEEKLVKSSDAVKQLAIVIDASAVVAAKRGEIEKALESIPKGISAKVFLADHRDDVETLTVSEAISRLQTVEFGGGVDDTKALAAARKFVGRDTHASIVWIHGAQVVFAEDEEPLRELLASGEHRLKINDLQLDNQNNDIKTLLALWSREATPIFNSIEQSGSVSDDLTNLFSSATVSGSQYQIVRNKVNNPHSAATNYDFPVASRLSTVWAADEARRCAESGQIDTAVTLGTAYRVVTPATGAVVMELESDYAYQDLQRNFYSVVSNKDKAGSDGQVGYSDAPVVTDRRVSSSDDGAELHRASAAQQMEALPAPQLQGATNGTISPQFDSNTVDRAKSSLAMRVADGASVAGSSVPNLNGATFAGPGVIPGDRDSAGPGSNSVEQSVGADGTVITGVNTPGTVRVNNLADLNVAVNMFTCALQCVCALFGLVKLGQGFFVLNTRANACKNLLVGSVLLLTAVSIPGFVQWLLGVQRDTNLFF